MIRRYASRRPSVHVGRRALVRRSVHILRSRMHRWGRVRSRLWVGHGVLLLPWRTWGLWGVGHGGGRRGLWLATRIHRLVARVHHRKGAQGHLKGYLVTGKFHTCSQGSPSHIPSQLPIFIRSIDSKFKNYNEDGKYIDQRMISRQLTLLCRLLAHCDR